MMKKKNYLFAILRNGTNRIPKLQGLVQGGT